RRRPRRARRRSGAARRPARFRRDEAPSRQGARRPRAQGARGVNAPLETVEIEVTVNGERVKRSVPARLNLPDFLRHELDLSGNYCRCTGYQAIVDAIEAVAKARAARSAR